MFADGAILSASERALTEFRLGAADATMAAVSRRTHRRPRSHCALNQKPSYKHASLAFVALCVMKIARFWAKAQYGAEKYCHNSVPEMASRTCCFVMIHCSTMYHL